ncbi:MAG: hypothetical protein AB7P76_05600 [Candidatus Melainabacteria bacterium]
MTVMPAQASPFQQMSFYPSAAATPGLGMRPLHATPLSGAPVATQKPFSLNAPPQAARVHQEAAPSEKTSKKPERTLWQRFLLTAPIIGLAGGLAAVLGNRREAIKPLAKLVGREVKQSGAMEGNLKKLGDVFIGFSVFLRSVSGIAQGVTTMQPAMILSNGIQMLPASVHALNWMPAIGKSKLGKLADHFGAQLIFLGGLYTLGFANALKNKDPNTPDREKRTYDMTRFKSVFDHDNGLTPGERAKVFLRENLKMLKFIAGDHVQMMKEIFTPAKAENQPAAALHFDGHSVSEENVNWQEKAKAWIKAPMAKKSYMAVLCSYLGTLPIVFLGKRYPNISGNPVLVGFKFLNMLLANMAPFAIAMNRDDWRGKSPLLGVPLSVTGMALSHNKLGLAAGYLGDSITDNFFSSVAVDGVQMGDKQNKPDSAPAANANA